MEPGVEDSLFPNGPIDIVGADRASSITMVSAKVTATLRDSDDDVVWAISATGESAARAELALMGYGATAPSLSKDAQFHTMRPVTLL